MFPISDNSDDLAVRDVSVSIINYQELRIIMYQANTLPERTISHHGGLTAVAVKVYKALNLFDYDDCTEEEWSIEQEEAWNAKQEEAWKTLSLAIEFLGGPSRKELDDAKNIVSFIRKIVQQDATVESVAKLDKASARLMELETKRAEVREMIMSIGEKNL